MFNWRNIVCIVLIANLALYLGGQDTGAAILHSTGVVLINRNPAPATNALFPGDQVETQKDALARIELAGSAADINPETSLQFQSDDLVLDHGSLSINTSRGLKVRVGCVTVTPVHNAPTHYEVTDVDGKVHVAALKDDVYLESRSAKVQEAKQPPHSDRDIVREGERKSREEKCGGADLKGPHIPEAKGPIMNSPSVIGTSVGVIGGVVCWAVCRGDDPISPSHP